MLYKKRAAPHLIKVTIGNGKEGENFLKIKRIFFEGCLVLGKVRRRISGFFKTKFNQNCKFLMGFIWILRHGL